MKKSGSLIWVSGFFGAGKTTLSQAVVEKLENISYVKYLTTRARRPGEIESEKGELGFITKEEYEKRRLESELWDHTVVADNYYGTDVTFINKQLSEGHNFISLVIPDLNELTAMKLLYAIPPKLIWIDTPLDVANKRLEQLRPDRIQNLLQLPEVRESISKAADYIFSPTNDLEVDTKDFIELIEKLIR